MVRWGGLGVLAWLLIAGLGTLALLLGSRASLREAFEVDARILHRVLSQRMEQQEAVLYALDALSQQDVSGRTLDRYAAQLLRNYPQLLALEKCGAQGCRTLPAGAQPLPSLPAVRPDQPALLSPAGGGPRYALALHRVRVWVDAGRLIDRADRPKTPTTVQVFRPDAGGLLVRDAQLVRPAALTFRLDKTLGTALQPFPIRFERGLPWTVWPWGLIAAWWVGTGLVAWWLARLLNARRQAVQAVQDERRQAREIVQASSDGLVALDLAGRVTQQNPAAQQVLGDLPTGTDIRQAAVFQATLTQAPFDAQRFWTSPTALHLPDGTALRRGGEAVLVEGAIAPLTDAAGRLRGRVLTVREVGALQQRMLAQLTDGERRLRAHEAQLAQVARLSTLGEMGAGLAHELNQPLTAILSYGQAGARLLDPAEPDLPRARQALEAMVGQARRAAEIIARLRALVRRAPTQRTPVDLAQAAQNILTLCRAELTRLDVQVHTEFPRAPALVQADPVQVEQIILNLIRNALDALDEVGQRSLSLELTNIGASWTLGVHDSGPGLSRDVLERLFTPFNTSKADGLGLGLTLSHTLAQGMDGDLLGENALEGGARFTLRLPVWTGEHAPVA